VVWEALEGETPIDPSHLLVPGVTCRAELDKIEAASIRRAVVKYLGGGLNARKAPFTLDWALKFHGEMFDGVWSWAGKLRLRDLNIGLPWQRVQESLFALLEGDLPSWGGFGVPLLDQSVMLHHKAVHIHPFENGNGRWSRLLANVWLRLNGSPVVLWPDAEVGAGGGLRVEYLAAIQEADQGEYGPLTELHEKYLEKGP
jgi:fido (protein-threonine AMPylation protein)